MTLADRLAMERFYLVYCELSKYAFEFVDAKVGQTWLARWDPETPAVFRSDSRIKGRHFFEATMIENTAGSYGAGGYGAEYYDG
jgi:hypothetical protein